MLQPAEKHSPLRTRVPKGFRTARLRLVGLLFCSLITAVGALSYPEITAAVEAGSLGEIERLVANESVENLFKIRRAGHGLLHLALQREDEVWRVLLDAGWPVGQEKGWSPQHEAALLGKAPALKAILEAGGKVDQREPTNNGTPLHVAAFNGHLDAVKVLVAAGCDINARDRDGWTALSQARDQGFPRVQEWLKKHGATR